MQAQDWANVGIGLLVGISSIFAILYITAGRNKGRVFTATNFWLIMSGVIHAWIEGSFVFVRSTSFIKPGLDYYASGDFRYGDPMEAGTAAMEAITAVLEGPLCWLIAYGAVHQSAWRHPAQLVLCSAQIYGLIWFCLHPVFSAEGFAGHITKDPFLFWFLVVGMNSPWAVFPVILWRQSFKALCSGMAGVKKE